MTKTVLLSSLISGVLIPSSALAGEQAAAPKMRFEVMDRNGDGAISRDEWRGSARSFQVHDWNGDGQLSGPEVRIGAQRDSGRDEASHTPNQAERYLSWTAAGFSDLDHNRDGRLGVSEWHYDLETFRRVDRNRDNVLTRAEFLSADVDDDRGDNFDDLDVDNDGIVDQAEWHGSREVFSWLDRNRDGGLTRFEVAGNQNSLLVYDRFASLDYDRNGSIGRNEWHGSLGSFDERDSNRDGVLSRREFESTEGVGADPTSVDPRAVRVDGRLRWTDTGISIRAGDVVTFDARGTITMSADSGDTAVPTGSTRGRSAPDAPILDQLAGGLIARIDDYGPVFVGGRRTLRAPVGGRLYLGVNDDHLPDNSGEFTVTVGVQGRTFQMGRVR